MSIELDQKKKEIVGFLVGRGVLVAVGNST